MAKREYSSYQKGIIERYYENIDTISLQKLQELCTEIYLAKGQTKKLEKLWQRADLAMAKLKIPDSIRKHILDKQSPEILAQNIQDWINTTTLGTPKNRVFHTDNEVGMIFR